MMAINIVDKVINEEDLKVIEAIAEKYEMSLVDFGRFIGKMKNEKGVRSHIRFSDDELIKVDEKANCLNLSRSEFCYDAFKYFMQSDVYKKVSIKDLRKANHKENSDKENSGKENRVCVSFTNAEEYKKMRLFAKGFSIPFSTLIRYCALHYSEITI